MPQRYKPRCGLLWEGGQCTVSSSGTGCVCTSEHLCCTQMGQMFWLVHPRTLGVVSKGLLDNESHMKAAQM